MSAEVVVCLVEQQPLASQMYVWQGLYAQRAQLDASLVAHRMATSSNECGRHNLLRTTCVPSLYGVVLSEFWQKVRQVQIADA